MTVMGKGNDGGSNQPVPALNLFDQIIDRLQSAGLPDSRTKGITDESEVGLGLAGNR
jgi:hypothetical protein